MSFRVVRQSKFRHVFGANEKREKCYDNIRSVDPVTMIIVIIAIIVISSTSAIHINFITSTKSITSSIMNLTSTRPSTGVS